LHRQSENKSKKKNHKESHFQDTDIYF